MNDYIAKPFEPGQLYDTLARWVARAGGTAAMPAAAASVPAAPVTDAVVLDERAALRYFGGKRDSFLRALGAFARRHHDDVAAMEAALAAGDRATVQRLAHTMKGLGAMFGMEPLRKACADAELAAREGVGADALHLCLGTVRAALEAAGAEAARLLPSVAEGAAPAVDLAGLQARLDALQSLLERSDFQTARSWSEVAPELGAVADPASFRALAAQIEAFEFGAALESLRALRAGLPRP